MGPRNYTNLSNDGKVPNEEQLLSSKGKIISSFVTTTSETSDDVFSPSISANVLTKDISQFRDDYVTYIHGHWYDLRNFQHPGGPIALSLAYHRDATVLFESHHPFASNRAYLSSLLKPMEIHSLNLINYLNTKYAKAIGSPHEYKFDFTYAAESLGLNTVDNGIKVSSKECDVSKGKSSSSSTPAALTIAAPSKRSTTYVSPKTKQASHEESSSDSDTASDASSTSADISSEDNPVMVTSSSSSSFSSLSSSPSKPVMDPFEAEIKDIVYQYFQRQLKSSSSSSTTTMRQITKTSWVRWMQLAVLLSLFIGAGIVPLVQGYWIAIVVAPTLGWIWMVNHWHDAAHFALSSKWYINFVFTYLSPWFSSPLIWYHQHVIGHHAYTNIPSKDPDLYHAPKFWRFQSSLRFTKLHRYQEYTTIILWLFSVPTLLLLKPLSTLASGLYNRAVVLQKVSPFRRFIHVLGRLLVASSLYVWPFCMSEWSFVKQFCFAFVPISVYSLWFMGWSQVNHHTDETSESFHPNWYRHQVMTSHTIAPQSSLAFWLSGGLNLQIEHHLFPFINQEHLIQLQPAIEAAARKHNVPYTKSGTVLEAFVKLWQHLHILSIPPSSKERTKNH